MGVWPPGGVMQAAVMQGPMPIRQPALVQAPGPPSSSVLAVAEGVGVGVGQGSADGQGGGQVGHGWTGLSQALSRLTQSAPASVQVRWCMLVFL